MLHFVGVFANSKTQHSRDVTNFHVQTEISNFGKLCPDLQRTLYSCFHKLHSIPSYQKIDFDILNLWSAPLSLNHLTTSCYFFTHTAVAKMQRHPCNSMSASFVTLNDRRYKKSKAFSAEESGDKIIRQINPQVQPGTTKVLITSC